MAQSFTADEVLKLIYDGDNNESYDNICLVCMDELDDNYIKLDCNHKFHYDCIFQSYNMITNKRRECPYCRMDGGYLPLKEGEKPIRFIHKEYSMKKKNKNVSKKNINQKKIKLSKKEEENNITLDICKCNAVIKNGKNKGKQCSNKPIYDNNTMCGIHRKKT